ncbi:hypothetical protein KC340_g148 [Hortaea werneckii]|nr:hypothetical protein KC340_g148 [Hortaea werneckii]
MANSFQACASDFCRSCAMLDTGAYNGPRNDALMMPTVMGLSHMNGACLVLCACLVRCWRTSPSRPAPDSMHVPGPCAQPVSLGPPVDFILAPSSRCLDRLLAFAVCQELSSSLNNTLPIQNPSSGMSI